MRKFLRLLPLATAALAAVVAMAPMKSAFALDKLTVAHSIWVGYGPLYIARDKGYFKDEGLDVDLKVMDDTKLRMGALLAGQIDAAATSVDVALPFMTPTHQIRYLFALDDSRGGDGIVADKSIANIAGLKGKKVGFLQGSPSELLLAEALKQAGLTIKDVDAVHMTAGDAGAAFLSGKIDAAVTWEPWLSRGKAAPNGHLLIDSTATPGLITDVLVATAKESKTKQKDFQGFYRAWVKAVEFAKAHPDEANQIMAKGVGGWLKDPKAFADALSGVSLYGAAENKTYIGTAAAPGSITKIIQEAADLWTEEGNMRMKVEPAKTIDYSIVNP